MLSDDPQSLHRPNPRRYSKPRPDPPVVYRRDGLRSSGNTTDKSGSTTMNDVGEPSGCQVAVGGILLKFDRFAWIRGEAGQ